MLHKETVSPDLLKLAKNFLSFNELKPFRLVGGTALALQLGHRKSIDLDFFTEKQKQIEDRLQNARNVLFSQ